MHACFPFIQINYLCEIIWKEIYCVIRKFYQLWNFLVLLAPFSLRLTVRRTVEFAGKLARIRPRKQWWPPIGHTIFFLPIIDKHLNESRNWFVKRRLVIAISPVLESFRCHFPQPIRPWVYEDGHDSVFFSFTSNFFANVKVYFE